MQPTVYQKPEIRDANDNIIQQGAFGKNTALANATNNGWIDYVMNNLEAVHGSVEDIEDAVTPKTATSNYLAKLWFSDTSDGAKLCKDDDLIYNPSSKRLSAATIASSDNAQANLCVSGGYMGSISSTGRLIITLPFTIGTSTGNRMLSFKVHIFDYATNTSGITCIISGASNIKTLAWTRSSAIVIKNNNSSFGDFDIAFGHDGTNPYVAIGNANTSWNYARAFVTDLFGSQIDAPLSMTISNAELQNVSNVVRYNSVTEPMNDTAIHNVPFCYRNLGTAITDEQLAEIRAGTFRGINVGDYWDDNTRRWFVAGVNYFYNQGNPAFTTNHIVVVPDRLLYYPKMNSTATTDGGYVGSALFAELEETALTYIEPVFGADNILSHSVYLPTTCVGGEYTGGGYYTRKVDLLNEIMVYGCESRPNLYTHGTQNSILPLFLFRRSLIKGTNQSGKARAWWLYNVSTEDSFCVVGSYGIPSSFTANNASTGVRPFFCVG